MQNILTQILKLEWSMFDHTQNIGGRADCQNQQQKFFAMRASQLAAWTAPLLKSYLTDLKTAEAEGHNLISEKYGYMMARTHPTEYARIKDKLPPCTPKKLALINAICQMQVAWLAELAARYPRIAGRGRPITREEDSLQKTSFETYLWGELATYSLATLTHYKAMVDSLQQRGENLSEMILTREIQLYGYASLSEAESAQTR